jgi:hypothetical protein
MNAPSTERVQRFRQRQRNAGNRRITLYLDHETQRKLDQLAGDGAQARYLEALVKAAIKREWAALADRQKGDQPRQSFQGDRGAAVFPGRRRSLAVGR